MGSILIPAEKWVAIAASNSCHLAVEHKGNKPLPVRIASYEGFLYTSFSVSYGPYGDAKKPCIDAYRLLPESMYIGDTTTAYHDEAAIQAGLRERGDLTGLIVSVGGERMVCAQKVQFLLDLPCTRPLSQDEAAAYDERHRKMGWRSLWFNGKTPEWWWLRGHPVAVYRAHRTLGTDMAVLLWKAHGEIHELAIDSDVLSPPEELRTVPSDEGQLALF
ncbi:hypothetical protein [Sulfuricystis multivorans]|uniref:hypothetical protein n=1 Tax=Sulfuricystis multivorans TaxID=2211108 RepID=UPI000F82AE9A|nr:hypothetical protein [Sulfuricystis multivorans]